MHRCTGKHPEKHLEFHFSECSPVPLGTSGDWKYIGTELVSKGYKNINTGRRTKKHSLK